MKLNSFLFILIFAFCLLPFAFVSCDIIEPPFIEETDPPDSLLNDPQNILLLEFTGHTCKSCPKAHRTLDELISLYGNRIVPVAFHLGFFALPQGGDRYTTDFRTAEGTVLEDHFPIISFPTGTVQSFAPGSLQNYTAWSGSVSALMTDESPVQVTLTSDYEESSREALIQVDLEGSEIDLTDHYLAVYLTESGIIDWQKDEEAPVQDVADYVHDHVFRTSFNGVWGELIGSQQSFGYGLTLDPEWQSMACHVIAIIYDASNQSVLQVVQHSLVSP